MVEWEHKWGHSMRMKTTIDIPEAELREAMEYLGAKTKRDAVVAALAEFNRRHRMAALVRLSGTCEFDANDDIEAAEAGEHPETSRDAR